MAGASLPSDEVDTGVKYLHGPGEPGDLQNPTGQNLVWFAGEELVRGIVSDSSRDIASAALSIENTISVTAKDGSIQSDDSFHQHGNMLYNGAYGRAFLVDCAEFAVVLQGTRFAFPPAKIKILSDYLLQGSRLMLRGRMLDYSAIGREISRQEGETEADGLMPACEALADLEPAKREEYDALKAHVQGTGTSYSFIGHKHFWNSDFSVHQRRAYYTSVKMNSSRTNGTESINGENLMGYWLPYGLTYIVRRGDEYAGIFPVWDWTHLPGVTNPATTFNFSTDNRQPGTFVGGVSDGEYGASAMDLELPSIQARKAWFFFDDEVVALGSGITSERPETVNTTLNQTLLKGDVLANGRVVPRGNQVLRSVSWVLHDGVGYVLPMRDQLTMTIGAQRGSWGDINLGYPKRTMSEDVLDMWISHGVRSDNVSYEYILLPGIDERRLSEYATHQPVRVLANSREIQAVRHEKLHISQVVFYSPGHLALTEELGITVDKPCIIQIRELARKLQIAISSPSGPIMLHLVVDTVSVQKDISFDLPGAELRGTSESKTIALTP